MEYDLNVPDCWLRFWIKILKANEVFNVFILPPLSVDKKHFLGPIESELLKNAFSFEMHNYLRMREAWKETDNNYISP